MRPHYVRLSLRITQAAIVIAGTGCPERVHKIKRVCRQISVPLAMAKAPSSEHAIHCALRGSCRRPRGGQTFLDQIALNFPVFERRQKEPVRLITMERLIWNIRFMSRIFSGFLQFASRFCSSPPSAPRSRSSRHHCFVLCPLPVIRIRIRERPSQDLFAPSVLTAAELRSFAGAALQNVTFKNGCFGSSSYVRGFQ